MPLKRVLLLLAIIAVSLLATTRDSSAQTANFSFDDMNGQADAGIYPAGWSFTIAINLSFAPGGNVANLVGLSYWFEQMSPLAPFYFSITNRDATGSQFSFLQTPGLTYPQSLAPANPKDLGATTPDFTGVGAGNYFIANLTVKIDPLATPGTYIIESTSSGGKTSVISDDQGHIFPIPKTTYTVTVVPFAITSIAPTTQGILLQGMGVPNVVNRIEASPDLSPNSFQSLTSFTPDSTGAFSFEDDSAGTRKFYRLVYP